MQIILVQTEVEQALRNYVASRLTLAVGTTFSIDLAATRGANGITATIDLVEPGQQPAAAVIPAAVAKPSPKAETVTKALEAPAATQVAQPDVQAQEQAETAAPAAETAVQADPVAETGTPETETAAEATAAPVTRSLFNNLARPKN